MEAIDIFPDKYFTLEEFLELTEEHCQLINGEFFMTASHSPDHQKILLEVFLLVRKFISQDETLLFAPMDVFLDDKNVFQPDLLFVSEQRKAIVSKRGIEGAPDLVIEILSPATMMNDRNKKTVFYLEKGVQEVWLIDSNNRTLEIYTDSPQRQTKAKLFLHNKGTVKSCCIT